MKQTDTNNNEEARALFERGRNMFFGFGGEKQNAAEAKKLFLQAAWLGDADAMCWLGYCFHRGKGVVKDVRAAEDWYLRAAKAGNLAAHYVLLAETVSFTSEEACAYRARFPAPAEEDIPALAAAGDRAAQTSLGMMYFTGFGGKRKNARSAFKWLSAAAEQDDPRAQFELVLLHEERSLTQENATDRLYELLRRSAEQGYPRAIERTSLFAEFVAAMSEAINSLSPEEFAELLNEDGPTDPSDPTDHGD